VQDDEPLAFLFVRHAGDEERLLHRLREFANFSSTLMFDLKSGVATTTPPPFGTRTPPEIP
jgi:hypothetical protein